VADLQGGTTRPVRNAVTPAGFSRHQFGLERNHLGRGGVPRPRLDDTRHGRGSQSRNWLSDGRERWFARARARRIIESSDHDVFGASDPSRIQRFERPDRHVVIRRNQSVERRTATQQLAGCLERRDG
jgi:hypothetical protein